MNRLRVVVAIGLVALAVVAGARPGAAQLVVFDPSNYAQNVLTATRAL
jgi:conjugal transfer/entry exclusion protein